MEEGLEKDLGNVKGIFTDKENRGWLILFFVVLLFGALCFAAGMSYAAQTELNNAQGMVDEYLDQYICTPKTMSDGILGGISDEGLGFNYNITRDEN